MGSSPSRGNEPIFSEEYVEREKRKTDTNTFIFRSLSLSHLCFFFLHFKAYGKTSNKARGLYFATVIMRCSISKTMENNNIK